MKTILLTGTPGTGKSFVAKKLSLFLHYKYFDIGKFVKDAKLYSSYDKKRSCYVVDERKLARALSKVRQNALKKGEKGLILDSHMSHYLPSKYANACILTFCSLKTLKERLTRRGYSSSKVRENLDAEIFDTCLTEAAERGHKVLLFSTTKTRIPAIKELARKIKSL
ncbi:MAG: adenylate kinase family protein [Candidatus Woesearchaeota archaeon]